MMRLCPDLKVEKVYMAVLRGDGPTTMTSFRECIGANCVAYKAGKCMKYDTEPFVRETDGDEDEA